MLDISIVHTLQEVLNIKRMKTIMMYANVCPCQCSRIRNDTSVSCRNYKGKAQLACGSSIKQKHVWHEDQVMRRWMLHGNVSRKGYGNALIGRYGGCFEERYNEAYDDRAYHAKGLDVPAKVDATSRSEKEAMQGT